MQPGIYLSLISVAGLMVLSVVLHWRERTVLNRCRREIALMRDALMGQLETIQISREPTEQDSLQEPPLVPEPLVLSGRIAALLEVGHTHNQVATLLRISPADVAFAERVGSLIPAPRLG